MPTGLKLRADKKDVRSATVLKIQGAALRLLIAGPDLLGIQVACIGLLLSPGIAMAVRTYDATTYSRDDALTTNQ